MGATGPCLRQRGGQEDKGRAVFQRQPAWEGVLTAGKAQPARVRRIFKCVVTQQQARGLAPAPDAQGWGKETRSCEQ